MSRDYDWEGASADGRIIANALAELLDEIVQLTAAVKALQPPKPQPLEPPADISWMTFESPTKPGRD